jgi:hypothetical protein
LLACPNEQLEIGPRLDTAPLVSGTRDGERVHAAYRALIDEVAACEAAKKARSLMLTDDIVVVLLARLLGSVAERVSVSPTYPNGVPLDAALFERLDDQLPALFGAVNRTHDLSTHRAGCRSTLRADAGGRARSGHVAAVRMLAGTRRRSSGAGGSLRPWARRKSTTSSISRSDLAERAGG